MATIVIVPAAFSGSWLYKEVRVGLQAAGHEVYALTLTGLGERSHLATPEVDLDTHTQDVVNVLEYEDLRDVVLVGHSYSGMVLSAVADRAADRLARLVYLDAVLPRDGECMFDSLSPEARGSWEERAQQLGEGWRVPPWNPSDRRMVPMPLKPTQQPLRLSGTGSRTVPGTFIHCTAKSGVDAFVPVASRARERGWPVYELATGHNPLSTEADRTALLDLLLQIV
jgi:pimeloyl-ACP methyl ester carboxylesterase